MSWKKVSKKINKLKDVKIGMNATLITENPWCDDAWVIGKSGQTYKIVELNYEQNMVGCRVKSDEVTIEDDDDIEYEDEFGDYVVCWVDFKCVEVFNV